MRESQPTGKSSSCPCERPIQSSSCPTLRPLIPSMVSDNARFLNSDKINEAKNELSTLFDSIDTKQVSDVAESKLLDSDESKEAKNGSVCTTDSDESLPPIDSPRAFRQYSQEMGKFGAVVLELRDGRRVAVPI